MPDCSRCKRLRLPCKASDRSSSCQSCLRANASSCDVFGLPTSTLQFILNEKRRLDREKKDTLSQLNSAASKLLRLEVQSRALEERAEKAFSLEAELLEEEESQARGSESLGAGLVASSEGSFDFTGFPSLSDAEIAAIGLDPAFLAGLGSAGGTAGASPGSSGAQAPPTS